MTRPTPESLVSSGLATDIKKIVSSLVPKPLTCSNASFQIQVPGLIGF